MSRDRAGAAGERAKWEGLAANPVTERSEFRDQVTAELAALLHSFDPPVERVLEAGCGSGLTGIGLIQRGFTVDLMDFSPKMLEQAGKAAERQLPASHVRPALHRADLFDASPEALGVEPYDCVFNAGVLEHYEDADIVRLLRAMGRLSWRYVIALVPNSRCVAYRWWRWRRQNLGYLALRPRDAAQRSCRPRAPGRPRAAAGGADGPARGARDGSRDLADLGRPRRVAG